jgi:ParB-like chromosome segregation protein Spo0J
LEGRSQYSSGVAFLSSMDDQKRKPYGLIWVELSEVDWTPGPCCMSFGFDLNPLKRSIAKVGLINPPFVAREDKGRVQVVAGYRRLMAIKSLCWNKVHCWDVSDLSPIERLHLNFYDNLTTRDFNHVEIGMVLRRLASHLPKEEIVENVMPLLGLGSHEPTLDVYLALDGLENPIKSALAAQSLSLRTLKALLDTDPDTRLALLQWITNLNLNMNQQLQLIDYTIDICEKEKKRAEALFGEEAFLFILEDRRANRPQKAKQLLELLRARRYPLLIRAEKLFLRKVACLRLPKGVSIKHPPYFEDPHYRLEIAFRNGRALTEKLKALFGLEDLQKMGDPWSED